MEKPPLTLKEIKSLYDQRVNIMALFRELAGSAQNTVDAILVSYDLQSGSYVEAADDPSHREKLDQYSAALAAVLDRFDARSVLEAGVGEATTLCHVISKMKRPPAHVQGFDLSWSRLAVARRYVSRFSGFSPVLSTGDLFHIPAPDDTFDVVFTSHAVEPNFGREKEALQELVRVARRWVVLFEPSYELGSDETRRHMEEHGYCRNLRGVAESLGYPVVEHRLLEFSYVSHNQTGVLIIEKAPASAPAEAPSLGCPLCVKPLTVIRGNCFCGECLTVFPVIDGIPCLLPRNGILASKYLEANDA